MDEKFFKSRKLHILYLLVTLNFLSLGAKLKNDRWNFKFSGDHKEEVIHGKNITGYNKNNKSDEILLWRGTTNITIDGKYKEGFHNKSLLGKDEVVVDSESSFAVSSTLRCRIPRGSVQNLVKTTDASVKTMDVVHGEHNHSLSRQFIWIRSAYTQFDIARLFRYEGSSNKHRLTLGMFPYQLDPQGIVLGDAYAVAPNGNFMGEAENSDVDQFACGVLLENEIIKEHVSTDLYIALLQNKSGSLSDTNARVFGHLFGRLADPARHFGSFNYVVAGKITWQPLKSIKAGNLKIIPFGLFNHEMEQKIELLGDACSKLGTFGIAVDYDIENFEASFQYAVNCGNQQVKGIDRNQIIFKNNKMGTPTAYNSHVYVGPEADGNLLIYGGSTEDQNVVNNAIQGALYNGKMIGVTSEDGISIFNGTKRYRDPYNNIYKGWMVLFDTAYWCYERSLRFGFMAAIASGDENPNATIQDGDYKGFMGRQELYAGKSSFFLGGMGRPRRPLSVATDAQAPDRFSKEAPTVGGFTNLRILGGSMLWTSKCPRKRPFKINPNIMAFWQDCATGGARSYLGTEANIFLSSHIFESLELFGVFALFAPGKHFTDRKGQAVLTIEQQEIADREDATGYTAETVPGISDDLAYSVNFGFKVTF